MQFYKKINKALFKIFVDRKKRCIGKNRNVGRQLEMQRTYMSIYLAYKMMFLLPKSRLWFQ